MGFCAKGLSQNIKDECVILQNEEETLSPPHSPPPSLIKKNNFT